MSSTYVMVSTDAGDAGVNPDRMTISCDGQGSLDVQWKDGVNTLEWALDSPAAFCQRK